MNPILRQIIFDLPLENDASVGSEIMGTGQKYEILSAIQKLFALLNKYDTRAIDTHILTDAFKWGGVEGSYQQDSQEFIRLFLFDVLERALIGTPFDGVINNIFKTHLYSYSTCVNCGTQRKREESSLDLMLPVKGLNSVNDSLDSLFDSYEIINDYKCDTCDTRTDLRKCQKIKELPIILNFPLNRFDWNLYTGERVKITSSFEYPLELNMKKYVDNDIILPECEYEYELFGVIVHRGTPYSGHYFSYIRDTIKEGNWDLMPIELKKQPSVVEEKKSENDKVEEIKEEEKGKKGKKKGGGKKEKIDKSDEEHYKLNFDECEYPIPYKNKELTNNWFCFDDTSILPIRVGRLIKQFKSSESAYVLFYMKKNIHIEKSVLNNYLQECNIK
jgi:ubiquitin C-terminal hydrolase